MNDDRAHHQHCKKQAVGFQPRRSYGFAVLMFFVHCRQMIQHRLNTLCEGDACDLKRNGRRCGRNTIAPAE
jgi:hypothetical protein